MSTIAQTLYERHEEEKEEVGQDGIAGAGCYRDMHETVTDMMVKPGDRIAVYQLVDVIEPVITLRSTKNV
jgi:hypothetical protein